MSLSTRPAKIQHFILVFDRRAGHLVEQLDFGTEAQAAVGKYEALEEQYRDSPHMDIVLVGSDSIETVQITHANYFDGSAKDVYADVFGSPTDPRQAQPRFQPVRTRSHRLISPCSGTASATCARSPEAIERRLSQCVTSNPVRLASATRPLTRARVAPAYLCRPYCWAGREPPSGRRPFVTIHRLSVRPT